MFHEVFRIIWSIMEFWQVQAIDGTEEEPESDSIQQLANVFKLGMHESLKGNLTIYGL